MSFIKNNDEDDKWKLMWIYDLWNYYKENGKYKSEVKARLEYTEQEMQQFEKTYWDSRVTKQQGKWEKGMEDQWLNQANTKTQYWEKFKEICLILIVNKKIDENKNMNPSQVQDLLCNWVSFHGSSWNTYQEYKKTASPLLGIMEHFWTVVIKPSTPSSGS